MNFRVSNTITSRNYIRRSGLFFILKFIIGKVSRILSPKIKLEGLKSCILIVKCEIFEKESDFSGQERKNFYEKYVQSFESDDFSKHRLVFIKTYSSTLQQFFHRRYKTKIPLFHIMTGLCSKCCFQNCFVTL